MFKKLRNRLLIVNTLIIAALVLGSFSVIYIIMSQNVTHGIESVLDMTLEAAMPRRETKPRMEKPRPPEEKSEKPSKKPDSPQETNLRSFTVETDKDGAVKKVNMPFDWNEDFYSDKMPQIIQADLHKIGHLKTDSGYWAYKTVPKGDGFLTAFTEYRAERMILITLFLILLVVGIVALAVAFLISLFFANRSIRPVEESYNKQRQFVADASHELKTPLTTINTNIDVLLSHTDSTIGDERKWLDYIKGETERMTKLTNDLLYLARLDHNDDNLMLSRVSFSEAAEGVILLMEAAAFEGGVNLTYDIADDVYVQSSSAQLRQLVMILLDNAVKYTPRSGNITVKLSREGSDANLTVRNSGEGISEEAQKQIFERFYREDTSRARESGGYGLGLAIAKAIVNTSNGSISVKSKKNEYAEFTVKLPIAR